MRLRTAIKVVRVLEEPWRVKGRRLPKYSAKTARKAWQICERKQSDDRVPLLPDSEQLEMRNEILTQLLIGGPLVGEGILEGIISDESLKNLREEYL